MSYVVIEGSWQYNDEIYRRFGGRSVGTPKNIFTKREMAEEVARSKNLQQLRCSDLSGYCYDINDIVQKGKRAEFAKLMGLPCEGDEITNYYSGDRVKVSNEMSDEDVGKVYDCLTIAFYDVVEVE